MFPGLAGSHPCTTHVVERDALSQVTKKDPRIGIQSTTTLRRPKPVAMCHAEGDHIVSLGMTTVGDASMQKVTTLSTLGPEPVATLPHRR